MLVFEEIKAQAEFSVYRAKIIGGWLVAMKYYYSEHDHKHFENFEGGGWGWGFGLGYGYGGLTFVLDPNHKWDSNSLSEQKIANDAPQLRQTTDHYEDRYEREPRW